MAGSSQPSLESNAESSRRLFEDFHSHRHRHSHSHNRIYSISLNLRTRFSWGLGLKFLTLYAFSTYLCHAFKDQKVNFVLLECTSYGFNRDSCEVMTCVFNEEICDRSCRHHLLNSDFLRSKFRGSLRECDIQDTILHRCLDFLVLWKGYYQTESI